MRRYIVLLVLGVVVGLAVITGLVLAKPYTIRGSQIDPPVPAQDFTLTDGQGGPWRLSGQQGKLVLVFFGYTTCPDVCPATLGELKQLRTRLGSLADDVQVVFITVDPQRDTPDRLGKYVTAFDPTFVGLSGSEADLQPVWDVYGVYRNINQTNSAAGYLVDHSARTYLIDRAGNLRVTYTFDTPLDDIEQDVRYLLREKSK